MPPYRPISMRRIHFNCCLAFLYLFRIFFVQSCTSLRTSFVVLRVPRGYFRVSHKSHGWKFSIISLRTLFTLFAWFCFAICSGVGFIRAALFSPLLHTFPGRYIHNPLHLPCHILSFQMPCVYPLILYVVSNFNIFILFPKGC